MAAWVGQEAPRGLGLTARGALRRPDLPAVAEVLGVAVPERVRSVADLPRVHAPWVAALSAGWLRCEGARVHHAADDCMPAEADPAWAGLWLDALVAACGAAVPGTTTSEALGFTVELLAALDGPEPVSAWALANLRYRFEWREPGAELARQLRAPWEGGESWLALLDSFGAVLRGEVDDPCGQDDGCACGARLTDLGFWAMERLRERLPKPIAADLSPAEVLARLSNREPQEVWWAARPWLAARRAGQAAAELLAAAPQAGARARVAAFELLDGLGDEALPTLQALHKASALGPWVRILLAGHSDTEPRLSPADQVWFHTEHALTLLAERSPADAFTHVWQHVDGADLSQRLAAVRDSGHPQAAELQSVLLAAEQGGEGRRAPRVLQLKASLRHARSVWRRVQMPADATLGDLHQALRALFGWGDDHLHFFQVGGRRYADVFHDLEDTGDEEWLRLDTAFERVGTTLSYTYDLGDCWDHDIALDKILDQPESGMLYPRCTAGTGDNPIEDWNPECPQEPVAFDLTAVNAALHGRAYDTGR